ncbi:gamma-glutamyltransferase family protein [Afipia carboxidovorans]|uniref:gamma-glutamyltransferase family protein n=1 Tax=Afipia carboxidovorans TaxID=40137 RepID=UPI00308C7BC8|nr:oxamate amidohydrolase [Afipia carboxidovorans]
MLQTVRSTRGMAVAPHTLAAQAAVDILRAGGNALEAMVAAASTIAVVYPHMNSFGGDGFWTISCPGKPVVAIEACGPAASSVSTEYYTAKGYKKIPTRGPDSANTIAGAIGGWQAALELSKEWGGKLPLGRLLENAIFYAKDGIPVSRSQMIATTKKLDELKPIPGFAETFLVDGKVPQPGDRMRFEPLGRTLQALADDGLDSFYRGRIAESIAKELKALGSPISAEDLAKYRAQICTPLVLEHSLGQIYNLTPPTQGLVSLMILGIVDRLGIDRFTAESAEYVHCVVEATKQAFMIRDRHITDLDHMDIDPQSLLSPEHLDKLTSAVNMEAALPWGQGKGPADTVWMGVIDGEGRAVSFIQSIYHEYGSGIVLSDTGINWQNRGCSFSLDPQHINALAPNKKPFHTLNPALARLNDGRVMVYGTMGGDGQPQTQAAVFTRYAVYNQTVQAAITSPRWLLGRTWGEDTDSLKLEGRFPEETCRKLKALGHDVEMVDNFDEIVGHAGAIVHYPNGVFEGGSDPRSNGGVASF